MNLSYKQFASAIAMHYKLTAPGTIAEKAAVVTQIMLMGDMADTLASMRAAEIEAEKAIDKARNANK